MQLELKAQEEAMKKIQELEELEQNVLEKLESTKKLEYTVNSILSSPAHKDLNLFSFNL